jgi:SRSO17 transposase
MTPQEIAEARPRLLDFTAEMLGGLPRKDQRAAGELYVRGLLTDGQRKSMVPMAARLGVDHQRLQQFITSSTWDELGDSAADDRGPVDRAAGQVPHRRRLARLFSEL